MSQHYSEIEHIIKIKIHELENESSSLDGIDELEKFWFNDSLKILTENLAEYDREHLRRRAWEMLIHSCRKIDHAEKCTNNTFINFCEHCTLPSIAKSLSLILVGSVARFEAEIDSDIDADIFYCGSSHCKSMVNDYFIVPFKNNLRAEFQENPGDIYAHSYEELKDELDRKYERIQNTLLGSLCIHNKAQFQEERKKIKDSFSLNKLITAREDLVRKEEQSVTFKERLSPKPKNFYHAACYCMQILVMKLCKKGSCEIDVCLQPYWKIFETLKKPVQEYVKKTQPYIYLDIRNGVIEAMKIREREPFSYELKRASYAIRRMINIVSNL